MPLFQIDDDSHASRYRAGRFEKERELQNVIEANLDEIFGVQFIASEFIMHGENTGRIDTLGLDFNGSPTIVEYKRAESESVINQGLYYMDWLVEHRGDFVLAAQNALGTDIEVDWSNPRLIIVAQTYAKWDTQAVRRMGQGIELWQYTLYGDDLFYLELVFGQPRVLPPTTRPAVTTDDELIEVETVYTIEETHLAGKPERMQALFQAVREGILGFAFEEGDIIETANKLYVGYRHGRNFAEIEIQHRSLKIHLDIAYEQLDDPQGIARDVSGIGHWGTGDVEVRLDNMDQLAYVLGLIEQSYLGTL